MSEITMKSLLESGVHFGHQTNRWNPKMKPYIYGSRSGIYIIDLQKTLTGFKAAEKYIRESARAGKKILFVATKKQAKNIVAEYAESVNMPYITERWPGGLLTNFATIRKSIKKMETIDKMGVDGTLNTLSKRERLQISRTREKLERNLGSIAKMNRMPSAIFIVDINKEHIAVAESGKLGIPTIAMVDTNSNPNLITYPIPSNDDSSKSIRKIMETVTDAVKEGLADRDQAIAEKAKQKADKKAAEEKVVEEKKEAKTE